MRKIVIIGGGNMGFAIADGITKDKAFYKKKDITFIEKRRDRLLFLKRNKFNSFNSLNYLKNTKDITAIIIAVKPKDVRKVLAKLNKLPLNKTIIISIAAGIELKKLSASLPKKTPIARVMPNTPCIIRDGMSVITFNTSTNSKQKHLVIDIFKSIGEIAILQEKYFNLVTALSGSGPAYFCYLIESLIKSGKSHKLNEKLTRKLVLQTAYGTTRLLTKTQVTPEALRKAVTSPNGTTEAAISIFLKDGFYTTIYKAINAAQKRAKTLSKQ